MINFKNTLVVSALAITAAIPAQAEMEFSGSVGVGVGVSKFINSDDDDEFYNEKMFKLDGQLRAEMDSFAFMIDASHFGRGLDGEDFDDYAPSQASAVGLHAGYKWGDHYIGAFVGQNWFQGEEASTDNGTENGTVYGLEGQYNLANGTTSLFAQLGKANLAGDDDDTGFQGLFGRVGMTQQVSDKLSVMVDLEYGRSSDLFEDEGDWGDYKSIGIRAEYDIRPSLIGEFGLDYMAIRANTEDDSKDLRAYVGLRVPFGAEGAKVSPLTTSYKPGLAAAWAEALD